MKKYIELWDAEFAGYSLSATPGICLDDLKHILRIHSLRPTCPCLVVKLLATWVKFVEPSGYCTVINCTLTFHSMKFFGCFHSIMALFELIKHKFLN